MERRIDAGHTGQFVVVDLNQRQRLFRARQIHRRHGRDRFAGIAHLFHRDHRPAVIDRIHVPDIRGRQDGGDAGQILGRLGVDRNNARVRIRAAQNLAEEHARNGDVADEFCFAGDFLDAVHAGNAVADVFELSLCHVLSQAECVSEANKAAQPVQERRNHIGNYMVDPL